MTKEEIKSLIAQVEIYTPRLAKWLRKNSTVLGDTKEYSYSDEVLPACSGTEAPPVGIVVRGVVEVQGQMQNLCQKNGKVSYPLALRSVGEIVGEVEFLTHQHLGGPWTRQWTAYAGLQSFYFTPLRGSKEDPLFIIKGRLKKRKKPITTILWLVSKKIDQEGLDIFNEISIKRLLPLTSSWLPKHNDISNLEVEPTPRSIDLFHHVLQIIQGQKMAFRSLSLDEITAMTPWDDNLLNEGTRRTKKYGCFDDCLVLGAFQAKEQNVPAIFLLHFLLDSLSLPNIDNSGKKVPGLPNNIRDDLGKAVEIAEEFIKKHKVLVPGIPTSKREIIAFSHVGKTKGIHAFAASKDADGSVSGQYMTELGRALKIPKLKSFGDLSCMGMLSSAALIILPHKS
jgi:hypothetical protein